MASCSCSCSSSSSSSMVLSSELSLGPLFMAGSSSFQGSRSMVGFKDVNEGNELMGAFFCSFDHDENEDEDLEQYFHQPEKKRRLTAEQVQFLERSFNAENKLEPERKIRIAKDLGLQPRQIAIWFQNRRARWRTKNLEKEYGALRACYNRLKADYDNLLKEKDKHKAEVLHLTDKLLIKDKEKGSVLCNSKRLSEASPKVPVAASVSANNTSKASASALKQDDPSAAKSDVLDSHSCTDGLRFSLLEHGDSSYIFEPDQSDLSQDEEDNLSKNLFAPAYAFPKLEYATYPVPPANSTCFGFPVEDHAFSLWSC